jgi:hypothetical protein
VPTLRDLKIAADGKPVAIPASALPGEAAAKLDLHVALGAKMLGLSLGKDAAAKLGTAVTAGTGTPGVLFEMSMSGGIYMLIGEALDRFADKMPTEQRAQLQSQRKLYAMYAKWYKHIEARATTVTEGIDFIESVEFAGPAAGQAMSP